MYVYMFSFCFTGRLFWSYSVWTGSPNKEPWSFGHNWNGFYRLDAHLLPNQQCHCTTSLTPTQENHHCSLAFSVNHQALEGEGVASFTLFWHVILRCTTMIMQNGITPNVYWRSQSLVDYRKTLNVHMPFLSWISWAKQNREIKGCGNTDTTSTLITHAGCVAAGVGRAFSRVCLSAL